MIRRSYQLSIKYSDWDPNLNNGRGGVKTSFGPDARRVNAKMNARLEEIDSKLEAFAKEHPDEITPAVIKAAIDDMPMTPEEEEKGMDFVDFCIERLKSEYDRNRIGRSRYENGVRKSSQAKGPESDEPPESRNGVAPKKQSSPERDENLSG